MVTLVWILEVFDKNRVMIERVEERGIIGPQKLVGAMHYAQQPYYQVRKHFTMGLGWQRFDINETLIIDKNGGVGVSQAILDGYQKRGWELSF